jgi:hypothetical protein
MLTRGPPELPGVHGRIGLDEVEPRLGGLGRRALAADDPEEDRLLEAEGVAEGQDQLAHSQPLRIADDRHRKP